MTGKTSHAIIALANECRSTIIINYHLVFFITYYYYYLNSKIKSLLFLAILL